MDNKWRPKENPRFGGRCHTEETKRRMSEMMRGSLNPMYGISLCGEANGYWKGGRRTNCDGYILIMRPEHPRADRDGYVFEHILVAEQKLGRFLSRGEVCHHLNGNPEDNGKDNIIIYNNHSEHLKEHTRSKRRDDYGRFVATV